MIFHRILHRFLWNFIGISPNILENVDNSAEFQNFWEILEKNPENWQNFNRILMY